ncbi:MAG: Fic family protein [Syntrophales bacterium]|nr:Fic family protein [Syntrophales bacterium]
MKKSSYQPPHTITPEILNRVAAIGEAIGRLTVLADRARALRLRRISRIRTIHGSLAIEGNTLNEAQITAILEGKRVIAPPREVQEVKNALAAYDRFDTWKPEEEKHLLEAHRMMMSGLIDEAGRYRHGGVGVMSGRRVVHMTPPADRVPQLMADLFGWLAATEAHPLIAGSVFHYEFEFIHPFADGNGRMGRLWQSLILARRNPLFAEIPVEGLIFDHQAEYYLALQESTRLTDSAPFIAFMLRMILDAVTAAAPQVTHQVTPQVSALLAAIRGEMDREALQSALHLSDRKSFRERYLKPALDDGLIEMTIPDKPNSRLQKYRLTDKGRQWLAQQGGQAPCDKIATRVVTGVGQKR